ncbi:hypothetical protein LCGC14_3147390 [marine sediment metagenome]|uniref:Recombination endonuclease VII n=1 Tax=marine sediment metagenome TaxID=412755 RepID=A0A0F8WJ22_9ZZZZ
MTTFECGHQKTEDNTYTYPTGNRKGQILCRQCRGDAVRRYFEANKEKRRESSRKYREKDPARHAFNSTRHIAKKMGHVPPNEEEYKKAFAVIRRGEGVCALCGYSVMKRLHVDHDHATGRVRGILCGRCNHRLIPWAESLLGGVTAIQTYLDGDQRAMSEDLYPWHHKP